jgi:dTDP-4-dehydrorhamnose 3,5-epimerase-like enzyme
MKTVSTIDIRTVSDERGSLCFLERKSGLPFEIRRIFYIHGIRGGHSRGDHAHREQVQLLMPVSGAFTVHAEATDGSAAFRLDSPSRGLLVQPGTWLRLTDFSEGAVCLVLCSGEFDPAEYIRDRREFLEWIGEGGRDGPAQ